MFRLCNLQSLRLTCSLFPFQPQTPSRRDLPQQHFIRCCCLFCLYVNFLGETYISALFLLGTQEHLSLQPSRL